MHSRSTTLFTAALFFSVHTATAHPWGFDWLGSGGRHNEHHRGGWSIAGGLGNLFHDVEKWLPCPINKASMPQAPTPLPPPSPGLTLSHVAIGRGTQNYTCPVGCAPTSAPIPAGAVASLYDASCMAGLFPGWVDGMTRLSLRRPVPQGSHRLAPADFALSGHHYFTDATTPFFDLKSGSVAAGKLAATDAPCKAEDVPWLKLAAKPGDWRYKEIYRVRTAGGVPPATCEGQPVNIQVQYAAEYWFWA